MDDAGNILIRRYAKSNVYIKSTSGAPGDETAIGADILKLPNQALESEKIVKVRQGTMSAAQSPNQSSPDVSVIAIDCFADFRHEEIPIERQP